MAVSILQPLATLGSSIVDVNGNTVFSLDATTNESHDNTAEITDFPVEDGSNVTDHVRVKPFQLTVTGIVTNTPTDPESVAVVESLAGEASQETVVQQTYELMLRLLNERSILTVVTGLRTYPNMMLRSVRIVRTGPGVQAIRPQMEFKEIRTADTAFVQVPADVLARSVRSSGASKQDLEQQAKREATVDEKAKYEPEKTKLNELAGFFGKLTGKL